MSTLRQYLLTLEDPRGLTRTLDDIEPCRDAQGRLCYTTGNSAVVFRIRCRGRIRALRCYLRPMRHLAEIYGQGYLPRELFLYTAPTEGVWADAVLGDWFEGTTLSEAIAEAAEARDRARLASLSAAFDLLAAALVTDDRAHGDLKPENIIVGADNRLHLIDFDAVFLPAFAGEVSPELGTAAFQHPARTSSDFDASLDDYPAALISTALHALVLEPALYDRFRDADGLLFTPRRIAKDPAFGEATALFERLGRAAEYRIAKLLLAPTLGLPELPKLLGALTERPCATAVPAPDLGAALVPNAVPDVPVSPGHNPSKHLSGNDFSDSQGPGFPSSDSSAPGDPACNNSARARSFPGTHDAGCSVSRDTLFHNSAPGSSEPELFVENGLWGYRTREHTVIPPLYDCGFDFTEGLAAVRLGRTWHYIDPSGRTVISCPGCEAVKPFRAGRATVVRNGRRASLDRSGLITVE